MEATEKDWPTVTIEAGGVQDPLSDAVAFAGLTRYALAEDISKKTSQLTVASHPIRVELQRGATVAYARGPVPHADLTLPADVDQYNFWSSASR